MDFDINQTLKMRRFFAAPEDFNDTEIVLSDEESRHLRDVLRLRAGERVAVFDGAGRESACLIEQATGKRARLRILEEIAPPAPESNLNLTLAVALLKGEKFDLVVQKTTELGVKKIVPLATERADVKLKDARDVERKIERWQRIALEACKQSGRAAQPQIEQPIEFKSFVAQNPGGILFAERGGEKLQACFHENFSSNLIAIVGAEGGWAASEVETAKAVDYKIVTLGGRVLRAETAAIVAVALIENLWGDLG
jgi:16S rRNA (uracil1498-N3)-methyltransferase